METMDQSEAYLPDWFVLEILHCEKLVILIDILHTLLSGFDTDGSSILEYFSDGLTDKRLPGNLSGNHKHCGLGHIINLEH